MAKRKPYNDVAERVLAAVRELNAALKEAYEHPQTKVHLTVPVDAGRIQFGCEVTRITKHAIAVEVGPVKARPFTYKITEKTDAPKKPKKAKKTRARKVA